MPGIPTTYRGIRFRSRVEARWAAFFDELGWGWDYEFLDLNGYIPDFVLRFHKPFLVEVKGNHEEGTVQAAIDKIRASGWVQEAMIVAEAPNVITHKYAWEDTVLGISAIPQFGWPDDDSYALTFCKGCGKPTITAQAGSYHCRLTGCGDGDSYVSRFDCSEAWAYACNATQYKPQ